MLEVKRGTVLKAKPYHPIYRRGGTGVAVVTEDAQGSDFYTYLWVTGDPGCPGFIGDVGSLIHVDSWFDIIPEEEHSQYLPADFKLPPDPALDPMEAFLSLFKR